MTQTTRRVVVTGAAGIVGYHLCDRLLRDGFEVVGVDNLITGQRRNADDLAARPGYTPVMADIIRGVEIPGPVDVVFNLACPASPVDFHTKAVEIMRVCSEGVRNMLELAMAKNARFVHTSTSECYGDPQVHPQTEDYRGYVSCTGPRSPYDEGKRFAEALILAYHRTRGLPARIVRLFNTYGERMRGDDGRVLPNFITQALANKPLTVYGDGSQTRSYCYVADIVEGIIRAAASDHTGPINLGNPDEITILQTAREIIELADSRSEITFVAKPVDDPERRRPDITLARRALGWEPSTDRRTGFGRTIDYFRSIAT